MHVSNAIKRTNAEKNGTKITGDVLLNTRAGQVVSPVSMYNYCSGTPDGNNVLTRLEDGFYVGGDTATYEYDFATKVAGSSSECPLKIYEATIDSALTPTQLSTIPDLSNNGKTGTLTGVTFEGNGTGSSPFDMWFNGSTSKIDMGLFDLPQSFSIEFTISVQEFADRSVFGNWYTNNWSFMINLNANKTRLSLRDTNGADMFICDTTALNTDTIYHIVYTHDYTIGQTKCYLNSSCVATVNGTANYTKRTISSNTHIGYKQDANVYSKFRLYNFKVFNTVLSQTDVTTNYNSRFSGVSSTTTSGLLVHYNSNSCNSGTSALMIPSPTGVTIYDSADSSVLSYGTWGNTTDANDYGGSHRVSNITNAYLSFTFLGTGINVYDYAFSNRGIVEIFIDGVSQGTYDCYTATAIYKRQLFTKTNLTYGYHTIKIVVTGTKNASSTEYYFGLDYFEVLNSQAWSEITTQAKLDRLKSQNYTPISNSVNQSDYTLSYNSITYDDNSVTLLDDFAGKITGSTTANPNIYKWVASGMTTLVTPGGGNQGEYGQSNIDKIVSLNGTYDTQSQNTINVLSQHFFSMNVIRAYEDKYGEIPALGTTNKVYWLRDNVKSIKFRWWGFGSSALGYKAYLKANNAGNTWSPMASNVYTTASTPTECALLLTDIGYVKDDGFAYFVAYADPVRTSDTTLLLLTAHGMSTNDIVENTTRNYASSITVQTTGAILTNSTVTGQTSGDSIDKFHLTTTKTAETGTDTDTIVITNHGLSNAHAHWIKNATRSGLASKVTVVDANTLQLNATQPTNGNTAITGQTTGDSIVFYSYTGTQTAESTLVPSVVNTDYCCLEIVLKCPNNYGTSNPMTTNFSGKLLGSIVENPNIAKRVWSTQHPTSLLTPSTFNTYGGEIDNPWYNTIKVLDGSYNQINTHTVSGAIDQQLFIFDLVRVIESKLGYSIPATDKVAWIKTNFYKLEVRWTGFGNCPTGNFAKLAWWNSSNSSWISSTDSSWQNTSSTPAMIAPYCQNGVTGWYANAMDSSGFVYIMAYTNPSDGVSPSMITTDYIELIITLKSNRLLLPQNNRRDGTKGDLLIVNEQDYSVTKYVDGASIDMFANVSNKARAMMIELDLTPIATNLFSGSNSAFEAGVKKISWDIYCRGTGSNGGLNGTKVENTVWVDASSVWSTGFKINHSSNVITKLSNNYNTALNNWITSSNKLYLLVNSAYASDGVIPSTVDIDYVNVKVDMLRTRDTITPLSVSLPSEYTFIIKGFAPMRDLDDGSKQDKMLKVTKGSDLFVVGFNGANFNFNYCISDTWKTDLTIIKSNTSKNQKFTAFNGAIVKKSDKSVKLYCLENGTTLVSGSQSYADELIGNATLYIGSVYTQELPNAYYDNIYLIPKALTDNEIDIILKGRNEVDANNSHYNDLANRFKTPNVASDMTFTYGVNAPYTLSNGVLSLTNNHGSNGEQYYGVKTEVLLPNNNYRAEFDYDATGSCDVYILNTNTNYRQILAYSTGITTGTNRHFTIDFTTTQSDIRSARQYIRFDVNNNASTFTIRNLRIYRRD